MTKQERVTFVINTLKELYPTIPVPLDHKDPYTLTDCCFAFGTMY
jgi:endonuclease-3